MTPRVAAATSARAGARGPRERDLEQPHEPARARLEDRLPRGQIVTAQGRDHAAAPRAEATL